MRTYFSRQQRSQMSNTEDNGFVCFTCSTAFWKRQQDCWARSVASAQLDADRQLSKYLREQKARYKRIRRRAEFETEVS